MHSGIQKFKEVVLKDVPKEICAVLLYDEKSKCACLVGVALKNLGYDITKIYISELDDTEAMCDPYKTFRDEFGFSGTTLGCVNDDFVRHSPNVRDNFNHSYSGDVKIAPAREVIDKVFAWLDLYEDTLMA